MRFLIRLLNGSGYINTVSTPLIPDVDPRRMWSYLLIEGLGFSLLISTLPFLPTPVLSYFGKGYGRGSRCSGVTSGYRLRSRMDRTYTSRVWTGG